MAKKTHRVPPKKKPVKPARGKAPLKAKSRKGARSQTLPGMEQVRNGRLDNLCEGIADDRQTANTARESESGNIQAALKVMQSHNISVYKHGGIELALIPGSAKLRVRLVKDQGDAEVSGGSTEAENGAEEHEPELAGAAN